MKQMVEAFNETQSTILASEVIEGPAISAYGVLDCIPDRKNPRLLEVKHMVEKPKFEEAPSKNAIIGRYILTPRIFEMLETITPGAGGELQLTDAIKALLQYEKVYGFQYEGKRHDAGDKQGFLRATVEFALKRDDLGPPFRDWLKSFPL
jgi:UTP--glucose-1-phosphate uridylyltransferase